MARKNNGLDLSSVGGKRLKIGGGSRPKPGLSFSNQPSLNNNKSQRVMPGSGSLSDGTSLGGNASKGNSMPLIILAIVGALAISVAVGAIVYNYTKNNNLKPVVNLTAAKEVLVSAEEDAVIWNLLLITDNAQEGEGKVVAEAFVIAADASNEKLSYLSVPGSVRMYVAGYGYKSVSEAYRTAPIDTYVKSFSDFTGVSFSHLFVMSEDGLSAYFEEQGVDYSDDKQVNVSVVTKKLVDTGSAQATAQVETLNKFCAMDLSEEDLKALIISMAGLDVNQSLFCEGMPIANEKTEEGYSQVSTSQWNTMVKRVGEGLDPVAGNEEVDENQRIRSGCSVTIWNGVGVSGVAGDCADHLESKGWNLESAGNAASFVYDETLVVYNYDNERSIAELLVSDLGQGRVVQSAARYNFEGDILVVVGKDYQPY